MIPHYRKAMLALCAAAAITLPSSAQISEGTAQLGSQGTDPSGLYWHGVPAATDAATHDWIGGGLDDYAKAAKQDQATLLASARDLRQRAANPKMLPSLKAEGLAEAGAEEAQAAGAAKQAGFVQKIGKVLEIIDIVSTTSKASAYAAEGDFSGATNILVKETAKKLMEGAAMAGLSWLPGGQLIGALAGEKAFEGNVEPILDANEKAVRDQEYADKYSNKPWLKPNEIIDTSGRMRVLPPDMYIEKGTGLIRRRSPEDQKAYENEQRTTWLDNQKWVAIVQDLADGKINQARYDELRESFRNRDITQPWDPNAPALFGAARFAGTYSGRFSGGGTGSIHFTVDGHSVSGTLSGVCTTPPCENDPVSGSFHGSITDNGVITTSLTGHFNIEDKLIGPLGFAGSLNGDVLGRSAKGEWDGKNKYGKPSGSWLASR
jgi:hypothetical protein